MRHLFRVLAGLFGTPRRAAITIGVMAWAAVIEQIFPGFLGNFAYRLIRSVTVPILSAVARLLCELWPLVEMGLVVLFIIIGCLVMIRGLRRR